MLGLCLGAASTTPASASLLGLDTLVSSLLHGEGGIFGHEGGVIAGDDQLGDVIGGFDSEDGEVVGGGLEIVGDVGGFLDDNIGGEGSFGGGSGALGGVLGGLLSNGVGLHGGVL